MPMGFAKNIKLNMPKKTQKEVIENFIKIHGDKYDYSLVQYNCAIEKVKIKCKKHDKIFEITPNSHLNGSGCMECGREIVEKARRLTTEEFIEKAIKIHGNKYDYSKTEYLTQKDTIIITCKIHGDFTQKPRKHLNGNNCKKCTNESYYADFVNMCKNRFPQYDYDKVDYKGMHESVIITSKIHGDFIRTGTSFYHKERGCPECKEYTKSIGETVWLDRLNISLNNRNVYIKLSDKTFCVDGMDIEKKIVYEYYGDFYHGNPSYYNLEDINPLLKVTYGELYNKMLEKEGIIKSHGYKMITIWENDFLKEIKEEIEKNKLKNE